MKDYEVVEVLENEIYINGNVPDIIHGGGFSVDGVSDVEIEINTNNDVSGTCTLETTHEEHGDVPFRGSFHIKINNDENDVEFEDFELS